MNRPSTDIPRGPSIWPDSTVAKITYTDQDNFYLFPSGSFPFSAGTGFFYSYVMNSPFYPQTGPSGVKQSPGLDEYAQQYSRYRVLASSIEVTILSARSIVPMFVSVAPATIPNNTVPSFNTATTTDFVKSTIGNPYTKNILADSTLSSNVPTNSIKQYISIGKLFGSDPSARSNIEFTGSTGGGVTPTSPEQYAIWRVAYCPWDESAQTAQLPVWMKVTVNYWTEFYARDYEIN